MANESANPNISEIQTKNGSVYDVAAKRFSGNRTIEFNGDVTANETGWDGSGKLEVSTTIADGAVGEGKIADSAVTNAKVADGAVNWDKIASSVKNGTIAGNYTEKLATCAQVKTYVDEAITGHGSYLGQKSVAEVNALTGMNNGDHVSVSDAGSITNPDGTSTSVNAGDNVIYDGTLRKWDCLAGDYKVKQTAKELENTDSTKTISKVTQNENGEVSVTYQTIGKVATAGTADNVVVGEQGNSVLRNIVTCDGSGTKSLTEVPKLYASKDDGDGTILWIGNKEGSGASNKGEVRISSSTENGASIIGSLATSGRYVNFPDKAGTIALTSDFDSYYTKTQVDAKNWLKAITIADDANLFDTLNSEYVQRTRKLFTCNNPIVSNGWPEASKTNLVVDFVDSTSWRVIAIVTGFQDKYYYVATKALSWKKVYYEATSTYSSTGTAPVNGTAVASAIASATSNRTTFRSPASNQTKVFEYVVPRDYSSTFDLNVNILGDGALGCEYRITSSVTTEGVPTIQSSLITSKNTSQFVNYANVYWMYTSESRKLEIAVQTPNYYNDVIVEVLFCRKDSHSANVSYTLPTTGVALSSVKNAVKPIICTTSTSGTETGSSSVPVYVSSSGEVKRCGGSLDVSISGTASKVSVGNRVDSAVPLVAANQNNLYKSWINQYHDASNGAVLCVGEWNTDGTEKAQLRLRKGGNTATIENVLITGNRILDIPDASGVIALTSDIAKKRNIIAELIDDTNDIVTIAESISGSVGVHYYYWVSTKKPTGYPPATKNYSCLMEIINRVGYQQINCYCDAINNLWFKKYRYASNGVSNWSDWCNVYYVDPELTTTDIDALWAEY